MADKNTHIVVIGAGYAGLTATQRLAHKLRRTGADITLVNGTDEFIERLRLHQIAANQDIRRHSIPDNLRGTGVQFARGWVTALHPDQHTITIETDSGTREMPYAKLLYALGSTIDRDSIPGLRDHAYRLVPSGDKSVETLRQHLPALNASGGRLLVCGGGATGIEAAAEFAESFPNLSVRLVTRGELGLFVGGKIARYMRRSSERLGVTIQDHTTITEVQDGHALTTSGAVIPFDLCLWTGGFSVPALARDAGLTTNERGQILIDPFMRSLSHPDIFAAGDTAHPVEEPGVPIRMSAFTALVTGAHAADCLSRTVRGKTPKPLSFAYYGQAIALGRHDAIGFNIYPADKPAAPYFTGGVGYRFREFFATFASAVPRLERRFPGILYWQGKGRYAAAKRKAGQFKQARQSG